MTPETFPPRAIPEVPPLGPPGPESAEAQRILDHGAAETREAIDAVTSPLALPTEVATPQVQPLYPQVVEPGFRIGTEMFDQRGLLGGTFHAQIAL
jgi:hypothetical protein